MSRTRTPQQRNHAKPKAFQRQAQNTETNNARVHPNMEDGDGKLHEKPPPF